MNVILPYWTGGGFKQAASWFLPPSVSLGLRTTYVGKYTLSFLALEDNSIPN